MGTDTGSGAPTDSCATLSGVTTVLDVPGTQLDGATGTKDGVTWTVSSGVASYPPAGPTIHPNGQEVNFTLSAGVSVLGIGVAGGGGGGLDFNLYTSSIGLPPSGAELGNYISSLNNGGQIPNISGFWLCLGNATLTPTVATTPNPATSSATDSVTVSGAGATPTGTVDFKLYTSTGTLVGTDAGVVLGGAGTATSTSFTGLAPGSYYFVATYNGDGTYTSLVGVHETFSIATIPPPPVSPPSAPTPSASLSTLPTVTGLSATDSATVSGTAGTPTGSVTFSLYSGAPGSGTLVSGFAAETVGLTGGTASSASTAGLAAGNYYFIVTYSGDSTYSSVTGTAEPFTIIASNPSPPKRHHKKPPPVIIPKKAPQTGAGGAARGSLDGGRLTVSLLIIFAGLALMVFARRRRRLIA